MPLQQQCSNVHVFRAEKMYTKRYLFEYNIYVYIFVEQSKITLMAYSEREQKWKIHD
jgi:hypothetical protein